ncbi:hypothetical protein G3257_09275 [Janthinobacterium lividum]|uniref:hypothetical protein n=1 Tax=Janthinobacterium lividum TaxID=29581 RepID=UPI001594F83E|nr:hypothetical protein [Janthinobacterium lividum]QKY02420.1 hypothetical protein G3257_09275 [Janthinobacterium lividum]
MEIEFKNWSSQNAISGGLTFRQEASIGWASCVPTAATRQLTVTKQFAPSEYLIGIDIVLAAMRDTNAFGSNDWATMARLNSSERCLYTPCRRVAWHAPPNEVAGLAKWEILKQVDDRVAALSDVRVESCGLRMQSDFIESPNPLEVEEVVRRTTCASRPGLAMPRAIGRPGSGACTMVAAGAY